MLPRVISVLGLASLDADAGIVHCHAIIAEREAGRLTRTGEDPAAGDRQTERSDRRTRGR